MKNLDKNGAKWEGMTAFVAVVNFATSNHFYIKQVENNANIQGSNPLLVIPALYQYPAMLPKILTDRCIRR
jgi:hypothetical protein